MKVLPEPVTPNRTWSRAPALIPSVSSAIACGWSPDGAKSATSLNFLPPSVSGRLCRFVGSQLCRKASDAASRPGGLVGASDRKKYNGFLPSITRYCRSIHQLAERKIPVIIAFPLSSRPCLGLGESEIAFRFAVQWGGAFGLRVGAASIVPSAV